MDTIELAFALLFSTKHYNLWIQDSKSKITTKKKIITNATIYNCLQIFYFLTKLITLIFI